MVELLGVGLRRVRGSRRGDDEVGGFFCELVVNLSAGLDEEGDKGFFVGTCEGESMRVFRRGERRGGAPRANWVRDILVL
jgi:hypothetical protein